LIGSTMNLTPSVPAISRPNALAVMMVICSGLMSMCRRISGNEPWPTDPNPTMSIRPLNDAYFL